MSKEDATMSKAVSRMLVCFVLFVLLGTGLVTSAFAQTPLAPGSIQVSRVQYDGNSFGNPNSYPLIFTDPTVSGIQGSIFVDQFTSFPQAPVVGTLALPSSGTSYITTSFSSKSEGSLQLSPNGNFLTYMGYQGLDEIEGVSNSYDTNPIAQLVPNVSPNYDRAVALIGSGGLVSLTPESNAYSGDNPRGAITVDGNEFYMAGNSDSTIYAGSPPTGPGTTIGARCDGGLTGFSYQLGTYIASDRTDESSKQHVKDNNWRGIGIYNDSSSNPQLFVSKGSGGNGDDGVFQVGTSLPSCTSGGTDTNNPIVPLFSAPATNPTTKAPSPYVPFGFWFANPTTLYVADEGYANLDGSGNLIPDSLAGLQKWSLIGSTWQLLYTIQAGLNLYQPQTISGYPVQTYTYGLRNMTGSNNGAGTVTLYAITSQYSSISGGEPDPTSLVGITDSLAATTLPANEQFVTLQTSGLQEVYRGVAFIPPAAGTTRATQTITFPNPGPVTYGVSPITLTASATSGWPIAYSVISGPATVAGNVLTITGAGSVVVEADQSGNTDYAAAAPVRDTITVNQEPTSVTWATPAAITYGTPLSGTQLDATASVAGSFLYSPAAGTVLTAGLQTLSVTFTPSDSNYAPSTGSVVLQVNQAATTTTWATPAPITYGTALSGTQLNATASVPGTFIYTPPAGTVLNAGTQTLSVLFTPTDSVDYASSSASVNLTVNKATQTISVTTSAPASAVYNTSFTVVASASSGLSVNFTNGGSCTNIGGTYTMDSGIGTCSVYMSQLGNSNYLAAHAVSESVLAVLATPTVSLTGAPSKAPFGSTFTLLTTTNASTSAVITTNNAATCSLSGSSSPDTVTIIKGSGTCIFTATWAADNNYKGASTSVVTTAQKQVPVITWASPAPIPVGTALSGTQLNASANVPGSFAYTPGLGTVLAAGLQTLSSTFTPTDTADYATVITKVSLQVNATTIVWATPAGIIYGTPLSGTQLNATANVPGSFVYTPAAGTVLTAGSQPLNVTFTPTDTVHYPTATAKVNLLVSKATSIATWAAPAAITYGTPLSGTQLNATANVPGSFNYVPASGTVLKTGSHTLSAAFTPTDTTDYTSASAKVTLQVLQTTTTTAITSGSPTVTMNTSGVATAILTYNVTSYKPTGSVTLTASTGEVCSGTVSPSTGNGSCKLTFTTTGARTIVASYGGDTNHLASDSSTQTPQVTVTVNPH